jgi:hypothetical protein
VYRTHFPVLCSIGYFLYFVTERIISLYEASCTDLSKVSKSILIKFRFFLILCGLIFGSSVQNVCDCVKHDPFLEGGYHESQSAVKSKCKLCADSMLV